MKISVLNAGINMPNLYGVQNRERRNSRNLSFGNSETNDSFERQNSGADKQNERLKLLASLKNLLFFKNFNPDSISGLPVNAQEDILAGYDKFFTISNNIGSSDAAEFEKRRIKAEAFQKTPEGMRRAKMSDEDIKISAEKTLEEIYKKIQLPKEYQPKLELDACRNRYGASYKEDLHTITFNPDTYRFGECEIEEILMHEAFHCKEALKRTGIPQAKADALIKNQLLSLLKNGEDIYYTVFHLPKLGRVYISSQFYMSENMKNDFAEFAKKYLYIKAPDFNHKFISYMVNPQDAQNDVSMGDIKDLSRRLETIMDKYPDFQNQYDTKEDALSVLMLYALSHNSRYNEFTNLDTIRTGRTGKLPPLKIDELHGRALKEAETSLLNKIPLSNGNNAFGVMPADPHASVQYRYTPEEVLAETAGQKFLIESLNKKQKEMEENGTLTIEDKTYFDLKKKLAVLEIKQRNTGMKYYENLKNVNQFTIALQTFENEKNKCRQALQQIGNNQTA